jgi:hypothetical protein
LLFFSYIVIVNGCDKLCKAILVAVLTLYSYNKDLVKYGTIWKDFINCHACHPRS